MSAWTRLAPLALALPAAACAPSGAGSLSGSSPSPATQALGVLGARLGLTSPPEVAYVPWAEPNPFDAAESRLAEARIEQMASGDWRLTEALIDEKRAEIDRTRKQIDETCKEYALFGNSCLERYHRQFDDINKDESKLGYYKMEVRYRVQQRNEQEARVAANAKRRAEEASKPRTIRKIALLSIPQTQELIAHCPVMAYEIIAIQGVEGGPGPRDQAAKAMAHALYGVGPITDMATITDLNEKYEECSRESLYHVGQPFRPSWTVVQTTILPPQVDSADQSPELGKTQP